MSKFLAFLLVQETLKESVYSRKFSEGNLRVGYCFQLFNDAWKKLGLEIFKMDPQEIQLCLNSTQYINTVR